MFGRFLDFGKVLLALYSKLSQLPPGSSSVLFNTQTLEPHRSHLTLDNKVKLKVHLTGFPEPFNHISQSSSAEFALPRKIIEI